MPQSITVAEGEVISVPQSVSRRTVRDRLARLNARLPFEAVRFGRNGMRAADVVGLIDIGVLQIEVLPKTGGNVEEGRSLLLELLSRAGLVTRAVAATARVATARAGINDVLVRAFAEQLLRDLRDGLPRRYSPREDLITTVRGRIDFQRLARRLPGRDHLLPVRYAPLQTENPLSALVRAVLLELHQLTGSPANRGLLNAGLDLLPQGPVRALTPSLVDSVHLTALERRWAPVVTLGRLLASARAPNGIAGGEDALHGLLFPLHGLFERVVREALREGLDSTSFALAPGGSGQHLLQSADGIRRGLYLRPDFGIVRRGGALERVLVGDAKWKRLVEQRVHGIQRDDAFQLATYMAAHKVHAGALFFPKADWMQAGPTPWKYVYRLLGGAAELHVVAIDIAALVSRDPMTRAAAVRGLADAVADIAALATAQPAATGTGGISL